MFDTETATAVIKTNYSHQTTKTTTTTVSKQQVHGPSGLLVAINAGGVSTQNKHLALRDRDTLKTRS